MILVLLASLSVALAVVPALLFLANLRLYRPLPVPPVAPADLPPVSVLIPARNELATIGPAVEAVLANQGVVLEVLVLDDDSDDGTADVVAKLAQRDGRVRLLRAPPLPPGWCGKQHACHVLARHAAHPLLVFLDADVWLAPDALARLSAFMVASRVDLGSGVPRQETGTFLEIAVIPLIHLLLLGFLPLGRMRRFPTTPAYGAGCGQLFVTRRGAYEHVGGHAAVKASLHDGLTLPRAYRAAGRTTDLFDATDLATCRMYRGAGEVWRGLAKNATEGLASPKLIVPATVILLGGQVLPVALQFLRLWMPPTAELLSLIAVALVLLPRVAGACRFQRWSQPKSWLSVVLHPFGVLVLLAIQWHAFVRKFFGGPAGWKGRSYPARP
jgi:hypothetical protein